jgi:hypothetical protein
MGTAPGVQGVGEVGVAGVAVAHEGARVGGRIPPLSMSVFARSVDKVDKIVVAVPELAREQAEELLLTILTLADASQALPNLDALYTGAVPGDAARLARRRAAITEIVRTGAREPSPAEALA